MSIYDSTELIFQNNPLIEENFSCKNKNQTTTVNANFQNHIKSMNFSSIILIRLSH